jgi:acetate kinase
MKILVLNAGSNTLKYQLFDWNTHTILAKGNAEKIGIGGSFIKHKDQQGNKSEFSGDLANHNEALQKILEILVQPEL